MSAIERLTPQDFGREFDLALFSQWKSAYNDAYMQGMLNFGVIIAASLLIYLLGLLGLILWFILGIVCIILIMKKNKKVNELNAQLGINKQEIIEAIRRCRKRK